MPEQLKHLQTGQANTIVTYTVRPNLSLKLVHERRGLLLDTVFILGLLNRRDQYHTRSLALLPRVRTAAEVWVTEAVLTEVGNALSAINRMAAVQFIQQCYRTANMQVVTIDTLLLTRALQLYEARPDQTWGLTDCISFVVMQEHNLTDAVMADEHFLQAGYRALMLESLR